MDKRLRLIISISIPLLTGFVSSLFTMSSVFSWYAVLKKPAFTPPNWIFGPVWTALYILMGISLYLAWSSKSKPKKFAFFIFGVQMAFNFLWSIIFFGMHSPLLAFAEIILLWTAILVTIICFYRISRTAAYLMIPYLLWVSFAALLNFSIIQLNVF